VSIYLTTKNNFLFIRDFLLGKTKVCNTIFYEQKSYFYEIPIIPRLYCLNRQYIDFYEKKSSKLLIQDYAFK
jgi:hypothetical protein